MSYSNLLQLRYLQVCIGFRESSLALRCKALRVLCLCPSSTQLSLASTIVRSQGGESLCRVRRLGTSVAGDLSEVSQAAPVHSPMNNSMSLTGVGLFSEKQK